MKKEQKQEWDANTLCIPYYHSMNLPTVIHNACREGPRGGVHRHGEENQLQTTTVSCNASHIETTFLGKYV